MYLLIAVLLATAALGSCATTNGSDDDDDGSGGGSSSGTGGTQPTTDFTLTIDDATMKDTIGAFTATTGNKYVVLDITLSNHSVPVALGTDLTYFSLTTAGALVLGISTASAGLDQPCRVDLDVAQGGSVSCSLAFEAPVGDTPSELLYDDFAGHETSASVPPLIDQTPCAGYEMMVPGWDTASCVACRDSDPCTAEHDDFLAALGYPGGPCVEDQACLSSCTGTLCGCWDQCLITGSCREIWNAYYGCLIEHCFEACT